MLLAHYPLDEQMNATAVTVAIAAISALGVVTAAVVAAWVNRRQSSGRIETSDAATLWRASEEMRQELREEVVRLRAQAVELLAQIDRLERRLGEYERNG